MPTVQYPFIDIAVHPRVRERFSRGEAMVLLSADLGRALWANGAGAELFGQSAVYDLLDQGIDGADITFRQLEATARQLADVGDSRNFVIRIARGFQRVAAQATVELIRLSSGERAVLLSLPIATRTLSIKASAQQMLKGLDDPDTHMAVIGANGEIIAASPGFAALGVTQQTAKAMTTLASDHADRLVKRPVATGKGYLPAAVGRLSDEPVLNLLFAVETVIGHLDPIDAPAPTDDLSTAAVNHNEAPHAASFVDAIDAIAGIEDMEEPPEKDIHESDAAEAMTTEAVAIAEAAMDAEPAPEEVSREDEPLPAVATDDAVEQSSLEHTEAHAIETTTDGLRDEPAVTALDDEAVAAAVQDSPAEAPVAGNVAAADQDAVVALDTEQSEPETVAKAGVFVFNPNSRATRFVWKIDAAGRFSEVSNEFAEAVGPHAADIIGTPFSDISALFNLDPEGKISEALARRDTWSGKTINWPIEGTSLAVPVDLAALPTYTRSREFDGFRGFGVVRLSDAAEDPLALGLTLGAHGIINDVAALDQPVEASEDTALSALADEVATSDPTMSETVAPASEPPTEVAATAETDIETTTEPTKPQPPAEPPALRIVENPSRRLTDKIVQLHGAGPQLTSAEQANFREIAKRLEAFGVREPEPRDDEPAVSETEDRDLPAMEMPTVGTHDDDSPAFQDDIIDASSEVEQTDEAQGVADEPETIDATSASDDGVTEGLEETVSQMDMLASFIPPRAKMATGLSAATIDQLPVAVLVHAGDQLIHANPEFMRLTGYKTLEELSEVGGIDALLQRSELEGSASRAGSMMLVTVDDSLVPVTARLQSIRWEESSALMLALMPAAIDAAVPARPAPPAEPRSFDRMLEKVAKLQVEVEELRSILETATDGVVTIGAEGDIRSMNRSASALFNYDEEETRGKPFVMLFAHESQKAVLDYLGGLSDHGVASVLNDGREVIGREAGGGFVPLFMTMGRLTSSSGYCAVIRDITQWKRTEDELRSAKSAAETANEHKTDFLARVSHEIRTPLNAIIGFSDMMATERFGPIGHPRYVEYANDIGRSGRHVLDIVNDLLDISKIEAGEMDLDFSAIDLNEAVSEAVSLLQPQANSQRVIIRTALSQAVPDVVADLRSIKQIALNILSNSIRFTPAGGQIVVSTSYEANGSVVLRLRDTGVGMTRSELDQAMKPFRQVSAQSRHRGDGTGLGLPLTKAMVDANRAIFAISSAPNEGTLVEIAFPSQRVLAG
ncbi:PAS domain S-box-containing protein [Rhizobium tibeticum]|uniref:histidine kinase n=1 Tax=Rhizobium tibeticum TaxID=501024 RepID=A0A1H8CS76_9HYPH|nr:PAS domain S-box protein [Rhizobium tibeticum]MDP9808238.1 PAS domain S-box-containing protein [Rhizobium tibeticum]SEH49426.1 Cell-division control histidine kinase PdhS [Rhizobium tibeticum]SEM97178.1 PAS/PAC sensor signal transduction histidine kinase [Rhizobium tibeticum]